MNGDDENKPKQGMMGGEWKQSYCDYIPPFATNCCDLRSHGNSKARWDHSIIIDDDVANMLNENTIFLFEILDFNTKFLREREESKLDKFNLYRVAWGILRPIGISGNHVGRIKIQLYKYILKPKNYLMLSIKVTFLWFIFDFIWPQKAIYNGELQINLNILPRPKPIETTNFSKNIFEVEKVIIQDMRKSQIKQLQDQAYIEEQTEEEKRRANRRRMKNEKCYIPDKVFCKFQSAPLGCFRLEFSHNGRYLAAACTEKSSRTFIRIFDVEEAIQEVFRYRGHQNLIHEISWNETDQFMVTCSSDFTAKVWYVPYETNDKITEEQSETQFNLAVLNHPSYVYSAKFHPKSNADRLIVVTACFDSKIRVFYVQTDKRGITNIRPEAFQLISTKEHTYDDFNNLLNHRHPNSLSFDQHGKLYVGDSLGTVHIFDLNNVSDNANKIQKINKIENVLIEGDPVNQVHFVKPDSLIVHSRDNCLRRFELTFNKQGQRIMTSYIGSTSQKFPIHSRVSPDQQFVVSGSEDGRPYLWDINGSMEPLNQFEYHIDGTVSDVSWSEGYHMVAIAGFGDEFSIVCYYFEKDANTKEQEHKYYQQQLKEREQQAAKYDTDEMGHYNQMNPYDPNPRHRE